MTDVSSHAWTGEIPTLVVDATDCPCVECGDDVAILYPYPELRLADVRCFEGHHLGWIDWPRVEGGQTQ